MGWRYSNPLIGLELLHKAAFWLYGVKWHTRPGSDLSRAILDLMWHLELVEAQLEDEIESSCRHLVEKQAAE